MSLPGVEVGPQPSHGCRQSLTPQGHELRPEASGLKRTGRCSNPPLRLFRPALYRLSYQSIGVSNVGKRHEKARCPFGITPGWPTLLRCATACYLTGGPKRNAWTTRDASPRSFPLNRSRRNLEVMNLYPVIDCPADSLFPDRVGCGLKV